MSEALNISNVIEEVNDVSYKLEKMQMIVAELKDGIFSFIPKDKYSQDEINYIISDYSHSTLFIEILKDYVDSSIQAQNKIFDEMDSISSTLKNIKQVV